MVGLQRLCLLWSEVRGLLVVQYSDRSKYEPPVERGEYK